MASKKYSFHSLFLFLKVIICQCGVTAYSVKYTEYERFPVSNSRVLAADVFIVQASMPTYVHCLVECTKKVDCISVNYNSLTTFCELNKRKLDYMSVYLDIDSEHWEIYEKKPCALAMKSGDHCHYMLFLGYTWYGSRAFCQNMGLDLVKLETATEQADFDVNLNMAYTGDGGYVWIGGINQTGQWLWADGSPITLQSPSGIGDCILAQIVPGTPWVSTSCLNMFSIVCERRD